MKTALFIGGILLVLSYFFVLPLGRAGGVPKKLQALWEVPIFDEVAPFNFTDKHLILVRKLCFSWGNAETGAPQVNQDKPYGSANIFKDLGAIAGTKDQKTLVQLHLNSYQVLNLLLRHGQLVPGKYRIKNITVSEIQNMFNGLEKVTENPNGLPLGLDTAGWFEFTLEHRKMLEMMVVAWPHSYNVDGHYPAPEIDPKRTYTPGYGPHNPSLGVDLLSWDVPKDANGNYQYSPEQKESFFQLHWSMLPAIQVFVENASIEIKEYKEDE